MRAATILTAILGIAVTACGGAATGQSASPSPTAAPAGSPSVSPASSAASPAVSPVSDDAGYWLRLTTSQAIPPIDRFDVLPPLAITGDGVAVVPGPVPSVYPGPQVIRLVGRPIDEEGRAAIVQEARDFGLLDGTTDFTGTGVMPGSMIGMIELTVDGSRVTLTGDPTAHIECVTAPCDPLPGSPAAFGALWRMLLDMPSWLAADLGPETVYDPPAYAIIVGPPPEPDPMLTPVPADWPLDEPLATFGVPVANGSARCGTATGADADALRPALNAANALTPWVQDPDTSATFGLTVRPMVPGEDACREMFGV